MSLDSNLATRWVLDTCNGDTALTGLLGGPKAYRAPIPAGVTLPAIAVGIKSVGLREGAIKSGPNTHTATPVQVYTNIWDLNNNIQIEAIAARLDLLLDGKAYQAVSGGGQVIVCTRADDMPLPDDGKSDPPEVGWTINWDIAALS